MTTVFWNYIIPVAFVGTVAALIFLTMQTVLQRMQFRLRLSAVLLVVALFLLPLPQAARLLPQPSASASQQKTYMEPIVELVKTPIVAANVQTQTPIAENTNSATTQHKTGQAGNTISLYAILPIVWFAGVLLALLISLYRYFKFSLLLRKNSTLVPASTTKMLWQRYDCEAKQAIELRVTTVFETPLSLGLVRPCVYVPANMIKSKTLPYALRHECMHIGRRHIALKLLMQAVCVLQWFNPVAWLMQSHVTKACEYACDELVTAKMNEIQRHAYGNVLLACATPVRAPAMANAFSGAAKQMYQRLQAVLTPQKKSAKQRTVVLFALVLVLAASLLAACAANDASQSLTVASGADGTGTVLGTENSAASGTSQTTQLQVPDVRGKTEAEAKKILEAAGLSCATEYVQVEGDTREDFVVETTPTGGAMVQANSGMENLTLWVGNSKNGTADSNGKTKMVFYAMPDVAGMKKQEAIKMMEDMGIPYEISYVKTTSGAAVDDVVVTEPAAGGLVQIAPETEGPFPRKAKLSVVNESNANNASIAENTSENVFPVAEYSYITARFSENGHRGTDVVADQGKNVVAAFAGTVLKAEFNDSLGWYVSIDDGAGATLLYGHCDALMATEGQSVKAGDVIATVGNSGASSGAHLHLEYTVNGTLKDPAELFPELEKE